MRPVPLSVHVPEAMPSPAWGNLSLGSDSKVNVDVPGEEEPWEEHTDEGLESPISPETPTPKTPTLRFRFSWRKLWRFTGPGWLMSLAYLDPGNLEANLQQGAYTNFKLVWVLWWATVTGFILQEMSARLGLVTGRDLAQCVREEYPRWLSLVIYVMMEVAVIGADIQEVMGSAIAFNLLSRGAIPIWAGCVITFFDTVSFLAIGHLGVRYLEALICCLIGILSLCFFANAASSGLHAWSGVLRGWLVPTVPPNALTQMIGTIGAVIMPHNLYLHSGLVLSRRVRRSSPHRVYEAICYSRIESAVALFFAFMINLSVVVTNSATFYSATCASDDDGPFACLSASAFAMATGADESQVHKQQRTPGALPDAGRGAACAVKNSHGAIARTGLCGEIGLENAGSALADAAGSSSLYVWALGLLAAGQASTMVCTYAGQIIMGGCLNVEIPPWKRVAVTRLMALVPALAVALGTAADPQGFNSVNEYLNILQSVQLPFAMLPALHFSASAPLLGRFRSEPLLMVAAASLAMVVLSTHTYLLWSVIDSLDHSPHVILPALLGFGCYLGLCVRLVWEDLSAGARRLCVLARRLLGSFFTLLSYVAARCCWSCSLLCGLDPSRPDDKSDNSLTQNLMEVDATIEGELLGRILTPQALRAAAVRASASSTGSGTPRSSPRSGGVAKERHNADAATMSAKRRNLTEALDQAVVEQLPPRPLASHSLGEQSLDTVYSDYDSRVDSNDSLADLSGYEPPAAVPRAKGPIRFKS